VLHFRRFRPFRSKGVENHSAASAGGDFFAFWLTTKQQHTSAQHDISYSFFNAELNGIAFMGD
jgi:hypothetical protein